MPGRRSAGRRLRRTWPQRLLIGFNTCAILAALLTAGAIAYGKKTVAQVVRISIEQGDITPAAELAAGDPQNFLIVGTDSDENLDPNDPVRDGRDSGRERVVGTRSDTIIVVRVDPKSKQARMVSFPRDLWVQIPGHGRNKINSAMAFGEDASPSLLMQTLKQNFGIDINHYVQVDLAAFKDVVRIVDGVDIWLPAPVRDGHTGLYQPNAGCVHLDADQALAFARSRYLQYQTPNGRWKSDPTSDIGRVSRQQAFIRQVLRRAISQGARNPATLARMVDAGTKKIALDQFTTAQDLIDLGRVFRNFDPESLVTQQLPVDNAYHGGAAALDLREDEAEPILAPYRGTGSGGAEERLPASVTIRVVNGTGVRNQGADTTSLFAARGFKVASPGADAIDRPYQTLVRYRPGDESGALLVARYLPVDPILIADDQVAEVTVVTGPDFATVLESPRPADQVSVPSTTVATTSTTAPETTTTTEPSSGDQGSTGSNSTPSTTLVGEQGFLAGTAPEGASCG